MNSYRYSLEKYSGRQSKHICPNCKKRTFVRYKDNYLSKYVHQTVGKCDRIDKCGYHYSPKMYFEDTHINPEPVIKEQLATVHFKQAKPSKIDFDILKASLQDYENNNFAIGLKRYFHWRNIVDTLRKYYVGTTRKGETIFWQVTKARQVRTGKIILYDIDTLKRSKYINWAHTKLKLKDFNLKQVFFGSHLLTDKNRPVAIAEGEKNAVLGALHYPQYNWIATGGETLLNTKKLAALHEYDVILFPDKGKAFNRWREFAKKVNVKVKVNGDLEKTSLPEGADIADLILEIKEKQRQNTKPYRLSQLIKRNPLMINLIEKFNLEIENHE